jgi:FkbM family methyltransferase
MRNGFRLIDETGTLPGTLAEVFVRKRYGSLEGFRTIVDVGANVGAFALYAAQSCPEARIYCYEPEQQNFRRLKRNIEMNGLEGRVAAFQCAVASSSDRRQLAVGISQLNAFDYLREDASHQQVDCTTLSDIVTEHRLESIDLLKMNCEGAEYEIFEGCSNSDYDRIGNIRVEYHNLDAARRNGESLRRCLETRGYRIEGFTRRLTESGFIWAARTDIPRGSSTDPVHGPGGPSS